MDKKSEERILKLIHMTDEEFYEMYISTDSKEEQEKFVNEFPELRDFFEKKQ